MLQDGGGETAEFTMGESYDKCLNDSILFLNALGQNSTWAAQMLDATGKPSPDVATGNLHWPGAYEQCLSVRATTGTAEGSELGFSGQYCTFSVSMLPESPFLPGVTADVGVCIPDSCTKRDAPDVYNGLLKALAYPVNVTKAVNCPRPDPLDKLAIAATIVFGFFGFLMALGTLVDILLVQAPRWRRHKLAEMPTQPRLGEEKEVYKTEPGFATKLLTSFSVYTNGAKLLNTHQPAGSLTCMHGIRFLSMTWIVLGHTFSVVSDWSYNGAVYQVQLLDDVSFQMVTGAILSVDTFYLLSGLLVAYLSLKEMEKTKGRVNWPMFYFHRFWRLTPVYMMVIFFNTALQPYLGKGPHWPDAENRRLLRKNCEENWWTNLLYINNFVNTHQLCEGESWYLATDMQFYVLSPLIFVPFYHSALYGSLAAGLFLIATTITSFVIISVYNLPPTSMAAADRPVKPGADGFADYYIKPYCRMGPYIIGLIAGYILYKYGSNIRLNKIAVLIGWLLAITTALACVFGLYDATKVTDREPVTVLESALYNAIGRTAWALSIAWVIVACVWGYGGFINTLLSWGALVPLSRLTYMIYLIHVSVQTTLVNSMQTPFYLNNVNLVLFEFGLLVLCYLVGAIVSLAFEAPMMALEKILLHRHFGKTEQK